MTDQGTELDSADVVVGGGPSGCAAAVFTARYGLDTVVFDRGNAALRRCASLENYLGVRRLVETIGTERVLDALSDEALADYLDGRELGGVEQ